MDWGCHKAGSLCLPERCDGSMCHEQQAAASLSSHFRVLASGTEEESEKDRAADVSSRSGLPQHGPQGNRHLEAL